MKKEVLAVVSLVMLLLAYVIDYLAGPVRIFVKSQIAFLDPKVLSQFPFTAAAVFIRTLGLVLAVLVIFSYIKRAYFAKAGTLLFLGVMSALYGFQQVPSTYKLTSTQWTLSIAYAGMLSVVPLIVFLLMGVAGMFNKEQASSQSSSESGEEKSVLEPPTNS